VVRPARQWMIILCGCLVLASAHARAEPAFVTAEGDQKRVAWWVLADFHPFTTEVRGIPVGQIRKSWCKATEFRKDLIPKEWLVEKGVDAMQAAGMSFAVEGRFDGSAVKQVALVGVYEECNGKKGRFVLVLDQPADGKARIRFVDAEPTDHQFGALERWKNNTIIVWSCMSCDGSSVLHWDRKRRKFDWLPQPGEQ
jgi:hypothetical protein